MKLGVLFSGGKDSVRALDLAMEKEEIVCLISLFSENDESYMFHTPTIELTKMQAEAIGLPHVIVSTKGEKEKELGDLRAAIVRAKEEFGVEGIVTGAVGSVYQAVRIQKICLELGLYCFNPLWQKDQVEHLLELIERGFEVLISGVFAYPFDENWLGRKIDDSCVEELKKLSEKYQINPAGEGGEIETLVVDGPVFGKRIAVLDFEKEYKDYAGRMLVKKVELVEKSSSENDGVDVGKSGGGDL